MSWHHVTPDCDFLGFKSVGRCSFALITTMNDANSSPRSPSRIHEAFISKVEYAISAAIEQLAKRFDGQHDSEAAIALRRISAGRSPRIRLPSSPYIDRDRSLDTFQTPDASLFHEESLDDCPCIVVEVSSRWDRKDLDQLAENWIEGSLGGVNAVIGFDIDAGSEEEEGEDEDEDEATFTGKAQADKLDKTATVSVWRLEIGDSGEPICDFVSDNHIFRSSDGKCQPGSLQLHLEDLLGPDAQDRIGPDAFARKIVLSYQTLTRLLYEAEGMLVSQTTHRRSGKGFRSVPESQKRKRKASFLSGDEDGPFAVHLTKRKRDRD